jgi:hypothetical protein
MKTHAIMLRLTTPAPEREVEHFAAELAEDARAHHREVVRQDAECRRGGGCRRSGPESRRQDAAGGRRPRLLVLVAAIEDVIHESS